jgi:hypothetical protein
METCRLRLVRTSALLGAAILLLTGCSGSDSADGGDGGKPRVAGPSLPGTMVVRGYDQNNLGVTWKVTGSPSGALAAAVWQPDSAQNIDGTEDSGDAAVSPNGRDVALPQSAGAGITYYGLYGPDVTSHPGSATQGGVGPVDGAHCAEWSPDGHRIVYTGSDGIYVEDLAGYTTLVERPDQSEYKGISFTATPTKVNSPLSCAKWLDNTHVVFDRRLAPMPFDLNLPYESVPTDTTTIANLAADGSFTNMSSQWTLLSQCGTHSLTRVGDQLYLAATPATDQLGTPNVAGLMAPADGLVTVPGASGQGAVVTFDRATCQLLVAVPGPQKSKSGVAYAVSLVDPETAKPTKQWTTQVATPAGGLGSRVTDGTPPLGTPSPGDPLVLFADKNALHLVDFATGGVNTLTGPWKGSPSVFGWTA